MINIILVNNLILLFISVLGAWLALWVYFANKQEKTNRGFPLMVFSIISWITFYHFATIITQHSLSLLWFKLATGSVFIFFISAYYFFIIWFLGKKGWHIYLAKAVLILGLLFSIVSVGTNLIIQNIQVERWWLVPEFSTIGKVIFYGFVTVLTILINGELFLGYFKASRNLRLKFQYFLTGVFIFAVLNFVFNVILPFGFGNYQYYQFGNYSAIFLLGFTALAIVKRELFGIKVVLTQLLVGAMGVVLLILPFLMPSSALKILTTGIFALFSIFGYLLIRITHQEIKIKEELQKAYDELKKLDDAKSEFIAMASHQLRTPLTIIKGFVSMLIEGSYGEMPQKAKKPLKNIFSSNERLVRIINDLLDISKIELGKLDVSKEKARIESLIKSILKELKPRAEKKKLYLKWEIPKKPLPELEIDSLKIRQAIFVIIDNAIRYTQKGGAVVKCQMADDKCRITVSDTGTGMSQEESKRIFESFVRGSAGINLWVEGAGLGLYLAKKYVELHNGKIWAESPGKDMGSTFHIELPIK